MTGRELFQRGSPWSEKDFSALNLAEVCWGPTLFVDGRRSNEAASDLSGAAARGLAIIAGLYSSEWLSPELGWWSRRRVTSDMCPLTTSARG